MDRGYEGDSGYLAHLGSAAGTDRWDVGTADRDADRAGDDVAAGIARRLQARLDRHVWLLERLQAEQLYPEPPGLPELQDTAHRMRRDAESLLLLAGHEPGVRSAGPRPLGELVSDAAAVAEEPHRVDVRPAPAALVAPAAGVEFVHVLAELIDHVTAVYPGARIDLVSYLETPAYGTGNGGATVDVFVDGAARHDPEGLGGRRAAAAAEQLARCSRHEVALRRPPGGPPPTGSGLVASVHCPPSAVTVEEPVLPAPEPAVDRTGLSSLSLSSLSTYEFGFDAGGGNGHANGTNVVNGGNGTNGTNGTHGGDATNGSAPGGEPSNGSVLPSLSFDEAPAYSPSSSSQVDELFGPLLDLPLEPIDDRYATPIFEAIASAWFREDETSGGSESLDWKTPQDDEWREAAARAARSEPAPPTTSSGLPRRRPGDQLVPPPRSTENGRGSVPPVTPPAERAPDRVRDRLSTYQRGLREGRHRAEGAEPEDW
ncbi:hypothetical protein [Pseudonocardia adelaidensis]|uniref:histidine kinase n=1 Tax=Pseudonocardia adelaidensis TaxID=648754 RepID=A0ABP9NEM0_9PSEU